MQGYTSRGITCWTGNDDEAFTARHEAGAVGAVSVASNLMPGRADLHKRGQVIQLGSDILHWGTRVKWGVRISIDTID